VDAIARSSSEKGKRKRKKAGGAVGPFCNRKTTQYGTGNVRTKGCAHLLVSPSLLEHHGACLDEDFEARVGRGVSFF